MVVMTYNAAFVTALLGADSWWAQCLAFGLIIAVWIGARAISQRAIRRFVWPCQGNRPIWMQLGWVTVLIGLWNLCLIDVQSIIYTLIGGCAIGLGACLLLIPAQSYCRYWYAAMAAFEFGSHQPGPNRSTVIVYQRHRWTFSAKATIAFGEISHITLNSEKN
jgi:hypothetical protein